jgi:hypothetical protein
VGEEESEGFVTGAAVLRLQPIMERIAARGKK